MHAFDGIKNLAAYYFSQASAMALHYRPNIIGHMEPLLKLNGDDNHYFDSKERWYRAIAENYIDKIYDSGCIVEVSTGLLSRGYIKGTCPNKDTYFIC